MKAPMPTKTPKRRCSECGKSFTLVHKAGAAQRYCSPEHKRAWENRQLARGQKVVTLAQAWRQGRHRKGSEAAKQAFTELCLAVDRMSAEDREAGRVRALDILADRYREQGILG